MGTFGLGWAVTLPEKNLKIVKSQQLIKQTVNSSSYVQEVAFDIKANKGVLLLLFKKILKLLFGGDQQAPPSCSRQFTSNGSSFA